MPTLECENYFSACSQPFIVRQLIDKECEKGFLSGLYKIPPFNYYRVSPFGLAVGIYSGLYWIYPPHLMMMIIVVLMT